MEQRITTYRETKQTVSYRQEWAHFRDERRARPETLGLLNASSMQHALRRLDKLRFGGEASGKDKPTNKRRARLYVQNVGGIKVKYHRSLPKNAVIKHVVLVRKARK